MIWDEMWLEGHNTLRQSSLPVCRVFASEIIYCSRTNDDIAAIVGRAHVFTAGRIWEHPCESSSTSTHLFRVHGLPRAVKDPPPKVVPYRGAQVCGWMGFGNWKRSLPSSGSFQFRSFGIFFFLEQKVLI